MKPPINAAKITKLSECTLEKNYSMYIFCKAMNSNMIDNGIIFSLALLVPMILTLNFKIQPIAGIYCTEGKLSQK